MAEIFAFPQMSGAAASNGLEAFVDDGELLEFAPTDDGRGNLPSSLAYAETSPNCRNYDWTNQERADLYRAHALIQAARPGLECDRGTSDEGDPWFLIGDQHGDAFIHICRIGREYILDSVTLPHVLTGKDFKSLLDDFLLTATNEERKTPEPANVIRLNRGGIVCLHPSMMIAALVWAILLEIDETTLPVASHLDDDEGSSSTQDTSFSPDILTASNMTDSKGIFDQESRSPLASGSSGELGQLQLQLQRDEKLLHASAPIFAYALTTIAAGVGLHTGVQALNVLWGLAGSQDTPENPSVTPETADQTSTDDVAAALDPLADAFATLSRFVDFKLIKAGEEYTSDQPSALDGNAVLSDVNVLKVSAALEALTESQALFHSFAAEVTLSAAGALHSIVEFSDSDSDSDSDSEPVMLSLAGQVKTEAPKSTDLKPDTQRISSSEATVQSISMTLTSGDFEVSHYNALSLKDWSATADYKSSGSYDILESEFGAGDTLEFDLGSGLGATSNDQSSVKNTPNYGYFSAEAREFIHYKLETSDMEIILFQNEILIVDKAASMGDVSSMSWQLDDGNVISVVGISAELSELLVA